MCFWQADWLYGSLPVQQALLKQLLCRVFLQRRQFFFLFYFFTTAPEKQNPQSDIDRNFFFFFFMRRRRSRVIKNNSFELASLLIFGCLKRIWPPCKAEREEKTSVRALTQRRWNVNLLLIRLRAGFLDRISIPLLFCWGAGGGVSNQPARSELSCSTCLEESQRNASGGGGRGGRGGWIGTASPR